MMLTFCGKVKLNGGHCTNEGISTCSKSGCDSLILPVKNALIAVEGSRDDNESPVDSSFPSVGPASPGLLIRESCPFFVE